MDYEWNKYGIYVGCLRFDFIEKYGIAPNCLYLGRLQAKALKDYIDSPLYKQTRNDKQADRYNGMDVVFVREEDYLSVGLQIRTKN